VRGLVGAMGGRPWLPTTSRSRRSENSGRAAVGLWSGVGGTAKAQDEWFARVFVVLMCAGVKALGFCTELSMAATMWRPAVAREFVARAEEGSRGGEQGWGKERTTCGGHPSRRWSSGGGRAVARGEALRRRQGGQSRATCARGRRREGRGPKDLCAKLNDPRDLSVKQNFPLI
jgi:hypothetical protein